MEENKKNTVDSRSADMEKVTDASGIAGKPSKKNGNTKTPENTGGTSEKYTWPNDSEADMEWPDEKTEQDKEMAETSLEAKQPAEKCVGENEPLMIVAAARLSGYYIRKYKLSNETKVTVPGWELKRKKLEENEDKEAELYSYFSEADGKKKKKLMKGTQVPIDDKIAYYFRPRKWFLLIILFFLLLLLLFGVKNYGGKSPDNIPAPDKHVMGEEKIEENSTQEKDDGIIYAGFPEAFTINSKIKYLSVQNSTENEGRFYTTVKLIEGDKVIYDMGEDVISPGKYVNIDLYSLLNEGEHEIVICQAGYAMNESFTQAATSTTQTVKVTVVK